MKEGPKFKLLVNYFSGFCMHKWETLEIVFKDTLQFSGGSRETALIQSWHFQVKPWEIVNAAVLKRRVPGRAPWNGTRWTFLRAWWLRRFIQSLEGALILKKPLLSKCDWPHWGFFEAFALWWEENHAVMEDMFFLHLPERKQNLRTSCFWVSELPFQAILCSWQMDKVPAYSMWWGGH